MPTLVLLRHAKTEPQRHGDPSGDPSGDRGRRLTEQGRTDAQLVRRWLGEHGLVPQRVVVSTATRAVETWELAAVGEAEAQLDRRVYEASPEQLRDVVAETGPDVTTLVLVGHNPSIERLAWELDDSPAARERTDRGMRPGGVAVLELDTWEAVSGSLVAFR